VVPPYLQIVPQYGVDLVPDIDFAVKDPSIIASEVITSYQQAFQTLTGIAKALAPADPVRLLLLAVCAWLSQQRVIIDFTGKMNLLKYAHDTYLDNLAALHGDRAIRLQSSGAFTTLEFTLTSPLAFDALIPKGTQCATGNVLFATLDDLVIPSGATVGDVLSQAVAPGSYANGYLPGQVNYIVNWNQPWGMSVVNTDTSYGGADNETDDQYRYRVWLAIESYSTCGPHDAYEFWALSADPTIIQAVVYSAPAIAGEVWIYPLCADPDYIPSPAICQAVLASCSATSRRPVADYVSVFPPTVVPFTLNIDYWVLTSNEVLLATIQANVAAAVNAWIQWQRSYISRDINGDELIKRCLEAGAKRIVINSPSPSFQVMDYNQLAVCDPNGPLADQSFTDGVNTTGTPIWTSATANFASTDVGLSITGTDIPTGTTILSVQSATQITLSQNTVSGTGSNLDFTILARVPPVLINYQGLEDA
jgi:phage-related baseplate assembly protein